MNPSIVAGVNALGRGQDEESLTQFITTIAQTMGPEALVKYVDPSEYIKRLAAAQGIDMLNLVKDEQMLQTRNGGATSCSSAAVSRGPSRTTGWFSLADPSKNPALGEMINGGRKPSSSGGGEEETRTPRKRKPYPKKAEGGLMSPEVKLNIRKHTKTSMLQRKNRYTHLGRSPNYVTAVGLGGVKVITNGRIEY